MIRVEHVDDAGHARLGAPAPRVAGQRHRAVRAAVIRAVARQDLVAAGERARDLDRVLVGFGAAVGEEEHVDVAGRELGELGAELRARLRRHERVGVRERSPPASWIARMTRSSPWPMFTHINWLLKSM